MDGGDLETFAAAIAEVAHWADAVNATDNTAARAHASNVAVAIALLALRRRAGSPGRLPRQEPTRLPGGHRRCRAARRRERLLPDGRRRDRRRRAGGAAGLRPRRSSARQRRLDDRRRPLPVRPSDRAGARPLHRSGREPRRAPVRLPAGAGPEEDRGRRTVPPAPDLLPPGAARGVRLRARARGTDLAGRDAPDDPARPRRARPRVRRRQGARYLGPGGDDRTRTPRTGRRGGRVRARARAGALRARASRRPRPPPRRLPAGRSARPASAPTSVIAPRSEREANAHRSPVSV